MERSDVSFESGAARCAAWLYRPLGTGGDPAPCVVLGHGFSAVREQRLDAFAERFAAAGLTALVFDYRHFGASGGEPRQLLDIKHQLGDWRAAIAYARTLGGVDPARVAIWGSSFGGGHVMTLAAQDASLAAAVSQVAFADGLVTLPSLGLRHVMWLTREGVLDQAGALRGRAPRLIPAAGAVGSRSVMNTPQSDQGMRGITPPASNWRNEVAARIALQVGLYRPARKAKDIRCPILFCVADDDDLTAPELVLKASKQAPRAEVKRYPIGHFDIYVGEAFERAVADQTEFLSRHLLHS